MGYQLGIDLGTTYTAAAVHRGGRVEIVTLGNRAASVPSVIFLREDESILTGDSANRRGLTEPSRVAREFKRRVGDPTPLLLGGTPYSAEALMARMLSWTVDQVSRLEGGPPDHVTLSHPANWGPYKKDLLEQAVRMADLADVTTVTEPEAAAVYYASNERVEAGSVIAVYDLGGGTFDAAVLRKEEGGWEVLGQPEGIERLGGIDFDEAVFAHVRRSLVEEFEGLDGRDPAVRSAVSRIRQDCIEAKEALSSDTEATIPVLLPTVQTEVRITRAEFEGMIRPTLQDTIGATRRALDSAHVAPDELTAVLLVGGSSRIPLVPQLISAEFGRPVAVDAHPKHAIALGAALSAAAHAGPEPEASEVEVAAGEDVAQPATGAEPGPVEAAVSAETLTPTPTPEPAAPPPPAPAPEPIVQPEPTPPVVPEPVVPAPLPEPVSAASVRDVVPEPAPAPPAYQPPPSPAPPGGPSRRGGFPKWILVVAGVVVVAIVAAVLALGGGGDDGEEADGGDKEGATATTTGAGGLDAAKAATVRIVARGSFTDPVIGEAQTTGSGSGFLIDESGIVVTNNHVVTGAASLEVFVPGDPDPKNAKVLGVSECSDLAVLDVDGGGYPSVDWADRGPDTGLEIFALGYPLGDAELTQTKGVVSKARAVGETNWTSVDNAIEHDATINPGNSGGPLVDEDGVAVGVNFAGSTDTGQFLAISAEGARELVETLRTGSNVEAIGVNGQAVVAEDGSVSGVWVAGVDSGSPADEAGVQPGDVIVTLEGVTLGGDGTMSEYCDVLRSNEPGATLNIEVLRFATGELLKGQINGRALGSA